MLKLFEGDVCCRRVDVEAEAMGILLLLVRGFGELLLAVVGHVAPLGVDAVVVRPEHGCG